MGSSIKALRRLLHRAFCLAAYGLMSFGLAFHPEPSVTLRDLKEEKDAALRSLQPDADTAPCPPPGHPERMSSVPPDLVEQRLWEQINARRAIRLPRRTGADRQRGG